jgi:hypothetical protein
MDPRLRGLPVGTTPEHFSGRADQSPTRKISAQARPGLTVGPEILAQARLIIRKARRASGLGPGHFLKSRKMMAQARPMLTSGPKNLAQARPTCMVGSGLAREFRAGPGRPGWAAHGQLSTYDLMVYRIDVLFKYSSTFSNNS